MSELKKPTLTTVGRFVADYNSVGTLELVDGALQLIGSPGEKRLKGIASGTLAILETVRKTGSDLDLKIIAELVADVNDTEVLSLLANTNISYDLNFINPDRYAPTSSAWWIEDGIKKLRHENSSPKPSEYFLKQLESIPAFTPADAIVLCSEYITSNWDVFKNFALGNKYRGARVWGNPNIRQKDPSLQEAYRNNFISQSEATELIVMAHTDLGYLFEPSDSFEINLKKFKAALTEFDGIAVITRGDQGPLILNQTTSTTIIGDAPPELENVVSAVGAGDAFAAGLFAQLLPRLLHFERIKVTDVYACIPGAHKAAALHMTEKKADTTAPVLKRAVPQPLPPQI